MAKMGVVAALFLGAALAASGAHAQWATVGAACSPDGIMANSNGFLTCTGGVWVANPIRAGNLSTCNSGNAGYIRWSGSAFEGCNGTSWIQLAGGSSAPTYLGVTSSTYNGSGVGGWKGANAKCIAQFGTGARMMTLGDAVLSGLTTDFAGNGWIDCRREMSGDPSPSQSCGGLSYAGSGGGSCSAFTTSSSGAAAFNMALNGLIGYTLCNASLAIHCVKD